jgi:hypothetical protein
MFVERGFLWVWGTVETVVEAGVYAIVGRQRSAVGGLRHQWKERSAARRSGYHSASHSLCLVTDSHSGWFSRQSRGKGRLPDEGRRVSIRRGWKSARMHTVFEGVAWLPSSLPDALMMKHL